MQSAMPPNNIEQLDQPDAGSQVPHEASCLFSQCYYSSAHSSRSLSFNAGTAEVILRLFQEDNTMQLGPSFNEEDDPVM